MGKSITGTPGAATPPQSATAEGLPARDFGGWTISRASVVTAAALVLFGGLAVSAFNLMNFFEMVGMFMIPATLGGLLVVIRNRPWTLLTGAVLISLVPILVLFVWMEVSQVVNPIMGGDVISAYALLFALAFAWVGAIVGFRQGRKGVRAAHVRDGWLSRQGIAAVAMAFLFLGVVATSALASNAAQGAASGAGGYDFTPDASTSVVAKDYAFAPETLTVTAGTITEVVVENRDATFHTFTYAKDGVEYNHDLLGSTTAKFLVLFDSPGTYAYWCEPHTEIGSDGLPTEDSMAGTITVVE